MIPHHLRQQSYIARLRAKLRTKFGDCCAWCKSEIDLEFAHLRETEVKGRSRGQTRRLLDVQRNPDAYTLLCRRCHSIFDGRTYRRAEDEAEALLEASREVWGGCCAND